MTIEFDGVNLSNALVETKTEEVLLGREEDYGREVP
jgi:hypothetical protein